VKSARCFRRRGFSTPNVADNGTQIGGEQSCVLDEEVR
jgi:hypothetical protein